MTALPAALLTEAVRGMEIGVAIQDEGGRYLYVNEVLAAMHHLSVAEHEGRTIVEVLGPDVGGRVMDLQRGVFATAEPVIDADVSGALPGEPGRVRRWRAGYRLVERDGERAVLTTVVDATAARRQESLARLASVALQETVTSRMLDCALDVLMADLDVDMGGALTVHDGERVVLRAGRGWAAELVGKLELPVQPGRVLEGLIRSHEAVVVNDFSADPRFGDMPRAQDLGVAAGIGQSIRVHGDVWGLLVVSTTVPRAFAAEDVHHLTAVAGLISAVVEREAHAAAVQRRADERRRIVAATLASADAERRRIAEVLHDDLLQSLLYARQESQAGGDPATALEQATTRLRGLIAEVHPVALSFTGLGPALASLAGELAARGGFRVTTEVAPGDDGPLDALVLGLARELLMNVVRHARAKEAAVRVARQDGSVVLAVEDDGCGLPDAALLADAVGRGQLGLASVVERAEAVGGEVAFRAGLGGCGTAVVVRLPR